MGSAKQHLVLVHGSGHGAWCWYKVRCRLEQLGHTVTCIDLAGCGYDLVDKAKIKTLDEYHKPLFDFMSALPNEAQVVLVGHSSGGLAVTRVIRAFTAKVAVAVYVSACMLRNGFSTPQDYEAGLPDLSEYGDYEDMYVDGQLKPEYQRMLLYNLSPPEDATLASMLLRPVEQISDNYLPGDEGEDVRRVYVKSLHDKIIKPTQQDMMIKLWPPANVFALESDHSTFFSAVDRLCDVLLDACCVGDATSKGYPYKAPASRGHASSKSNTFRAVAVHRRDLIEQWYKSLLATVLLLLLLLLLVLMVALLGWMMYNSMLGVRSRTYISNGRGAWNQ